VSQWFADVLEGERVIEGKNKIAQCRKTNRKQNFIRGNGVESDPDLIDMILFQKFVKQEYGKCKKDNGKKGC